MFSCFLVAFSTVYYTGYKALEFCAYAADYNSLTEEEQLELKKQLKSERRKERMSLRKAKREERLEKIEREMKKYAMLDGSSADDKCRMRDR